MAMGQISRSTERISSLENKGFNQFCENIQLHLIIFWQDFDQKNSLIFIYQHIIRNVTNLAKFTAY